MSFDPSVEVIQEWVVDYAQHGELLVYQPEGDGDKGEAMNKVGRSCIHVRAVAAASVTISVTVDGVNAERWVVGQVRSGSCRIGLLPDAIAMSVMVALIPRIDTHNWKPG